MRLQTGAAIDGFHLPTRAPGLHFLALFILFASSSVHSGEFIATGDMTVARSDHTATLLDNGKVLIVGGFGIATTAELYDPVAGTFTSTSGQPLYQEGGGRRYHAAVRLNDGRVLIVGGGNLFAEVQGAPIPFAEIYDPDTDAFVATGAMAQERFLIRPALLHDGRVLIAGGYGCCNTYLENGEPMAFFNTALGSMEVFDPDTGIFSLIDDGDESLPLPPSPTLLNAPRGEATTIRLDDGRVLIAGGRSYQYAPLPDSPNVYWHHPATADIFDPSNPLMVTPTGTPMTLGRPSSASVLLQNGEVLMALWLAYDPITNTHVPNAHAERYDPATDSFSPAATPPTGFADLDRQLHTDQIVVLDDGRVLFAGGLIHSELVGGNPTDDLRADLYDPDTDTYAPAAGTMILPRSSHTATKLADGRVLLTGGINFAGGQHNQLASAEIYDPDAEIDGPNLIFASRFEALSKLTFAPSFSRSLNLQSHPHLTINEFGAIVHSTCPDAIELMEKVGAFRDGARASTFADLNNNQICHTKSILSP